jgi:antitoxin component YwqK of YwqJK toxin-antitoxin module
MIKYLLLFFLFSVLVFGAAAVPIDTAVMFFNRSGQTVRTLDSAAYYMLILPPTPDDARYNIQEFYRNGKIKLIGKSDAHENSMRTGIVRFEGECTTYYPNGNKSATIYYKMGYKDGQEYLYYPNGNVLSVIKHVQGSSAIFDKNFFWDCYDDKGNTICKEGNGRWITYDDSCKYIQYGGPVKNGLMEGTWTGKIFQPDTINYTFVFKNSRVQSSTGYDKNGKAYPFTNEYERATYRSGPLVFLERLRNRIKMPKDTDGEKISIDTMHVSFVVERDGKLSQFEISGTVAPQVKAAVFAALEKSNEWIPSKVYGVPFRTRVILPLSEISGWNTKYKGWESYHKEIQYSEMILKD